MLRNYISHWKTCFFSENRSINRNIEGDEWMYKNRIASHQKSCERGEFYWGIKEVKFTKNKEKPRLGHYPKQKPPTNHLTALQIKTHYHEELWPN